MNRGFFLTIGGYHVSPRRRNEYTINAFREVSMFSNFHSDTETRIFRLGGGETPEVRLNNISSQKPKKVSDTRGKFVKRGYDFSFTWVSVG